MSRFEWEKFIDTAWVLLKEGNEAAYRSAVSRAYYALHNVAKPYCEKIASRPSSRPEGHSHKALVGILRREAPQLGADVGRKLHELRDARNIADYEDDEFYTFEETRAFVISAHRAIGVIKTLDRQLR